MVEKKLISTQIVSLTETIENIIYEIVKFFQSGNEHKGSSNFIDFTYAFHELLNVLGNNEYEMDSGAVIAPLNSLLLELMSAFQNENYVWVNDILEYEFIPLIRQLKNSFS